MYVCVRLFTQFFTRRRFIRYSCHRTEHFLLLAFRWEDESQLSVLPTAAAWLWCSSTWTQLWWWHDAAKNTCDAALTVPSDQQST